MGQVTLSAWAQQPLCGVVHLELPSAFHVQITSDYSQPKVESIFVERENPTTKPVVTPGVSCQVGHKHFFTTSSSYKGMFALWAPKLMEQCYSNQSFTLVFPFFPFCLPS